jgi:hypothetical protein
MVKIPTSHLRSQFLVGLFTIATAWTLPLPAAAQSRENPHRDGERPAAQAERRTPERPRQAAPAEQRRPREAAPAAVPRAVPRPVPPQAAVVPGHAVPRPYYPSIVRGPVGVRVYAEPRVYGYARPRAMVPVVVYPRPYYVFHPRYLIGFGIYAGVPIPYPIAYGYPTYVYGAPVYGPPAAVAAPPPDSYGGIALDISPDNAEVSVDGSFVGDARDFAPTRQPLTLAPGRHHIELQAPGLEPLAFDVDVAPGQVIPYRGALQPSF